MSALMRFEANLQRKLGYDQANEPTIPGPVTSNDMRLWDGYYVGGCGALDPNSYDDLTAKFVDADTGSDLNPGTELLPFKTIQYGIDNLGVTIVVLIIKGTFRERIAIGKPVWGPRDIPSIIAYSGVIAIIKCPNEYSEEEGQLGWNWYPAYPAPVPTDLLNTIIYGLNVRGDYFDVDDRFAYFLPNYEFSRAAGNYNAYAWKLGDGRFVEHASATFAPNWLSMMRVQNSITKFLCALMLPPNSAASQNIFIYKFANPNQQQLSVARNTVLTYSDSAGQFGWGWGAQPAGTYASTTHYRGTNYSGWVVSICRGKYEFYCATTSLTTTIGNLPDYAQEKITIYKLIDNAWTVVADWVPTYKTFHYVTAGDYCTIWINYFYCGLLSANENLYWCQPKMAGVSGNDYPSSCGCGDLKVSSDKGVTWQNILINGYVNLDDVIFFKNNYYATCRGKLYRSSDGKTNWALLYSKTNYWFNKMNIINGVLFVSSIASQRIYIYSFDGISFREKILSPAPTCRGGGGLF